MIEQIEDFRDPINPNAPDGEPPLDADVHSVKGRPDEVVARDDGAVSTQAIGGKGPHLPQIAAVGGRAALPGAVEIQAAHLEAIRHFPDAIEHGPMSLVADRERPFALVVRREWKADVRL